MYSTVNNDRLYEHVRIVKMHNRHIIGVFGSKVAFMIVVIQFMKERTCVVFRGVNGCILLLDVLCYRFIFQQILFSALGCQG
jgi:hypothetical protein